MVFPIIMTIPTWFWTLLAAVLFSINALYWYWQHPDDLVGLVLYAAVACIFYIATIGHWTSSRKKS